MRTLLYFFLSLIDTIIWGALGLAGVLRIFLIPLIPLAVLYIVFVFIAKEEFGWFEDYKP